jgi:hypothetical protein
MEAFADADVRVLATRIATTVEELELAAGEALLVLPNAEFFPDRFTGDQASLERLAARMQGYAGLETVAIDAVLAGETALDEGGACGTGGCGSCAPAGVDPNGPRLARTPEGYRITVPTAELGHPIVLGSRLATALGAVAVFENGAADEARLTTADAECAATALGFGVLLLEASYLYAKSCGGPRVDRATALGCDELAMLFALCAARDGHALGPALAELGTTQRALVRAAGTVVDASPELVRLLREDPARVASGRFRLREGRSWLERFFGRSAVNKSDQDRLDDALGALERGASVDEVAALLEIDGR